MSTVYTQPAFSERMPHDRHLEREEAKLISALKRHAPELYDLYFQMIPVGREGILQRLLSSVIRENISGLGASRRILLRNGDVWKIAPGIPGCADTEHRWIDQVTTYFNTNDLLPFDVKRIDLLFFANLNRYVSVPVSGEYGFERIQTTGPYLLFRKDLAPRKIIHAAEVLQLLHEEGWDKAPSSLRMFCDDVCNSTANLTLAYAYREWKMQQNQASTSDKTAISSDPSAYARLEQLVLEGHPNHPGAKMRKGLSPEETLRYSAEFGRKIKLPFAAVHKRFVYSAAMESDHSWNDILFEREPDLRHHAAEQLARLGLSLSDYCIMPVHPWQLEHVVPTMYANEIRNLTIVPIENVTSSYLASMSFRTLVPEADGRKPHVKLAVRIHLTGEVRTLSEQTIHNGPLMSRILRKLVAEDPLIPQARFIPVMELAGAHFLHPLDRGETQTERSENLAGVLRENVYRYVKKGEIPVVASALVAVSPASGDPLFAEWIARYQKASGLDNLIEAVLSFFRRYTSHMLEGLIPLMVKYGIGLEGHLQNTVPVFREDGTPVKILVRDWEGIRVHRQRLKQAGFDPDWFHPKSRILADDLKSVHNKMFYAAVQNHLGELILEFTRYYSMEEHSFWSIVRSIMLDLFNRLEKDPLYRENARTDREMIFGERTDYKAVTLMRMKGEAHHYTYVKVKNPLCD